MTRLKTAAEALLADVRARYPGEELKCPHMIELDAAVKEDSFDLYQYVAELRGITREQAKHRITKACYDAAFDPVADVRAFFDKFHVPYETKPVWPETELLDFRLKHLTEEYGELLLAYTEEDIAKFADALVDVVYLAIGTALTCGIPFKAVWREVQAANLRKERATGPDDPRGTRGCSFDVVKPTGWVPPNVEAAIAGGTE